VQTYGEVERAQNPDSRKEENVLTEGGVRNRDYRDLLGGHATGGGGS